MRTPKVEKRKWNEMTYDARIAKLVSVIRNLLPMVNEANRAWGDFSSHSHDSKGSPVVVRQIGWNQPRPVDYPNSTTQGGTNEIDPFYDIDFSDVEVRN